MPQNGLRVFVSTTSKALPGYGRAAFEVCTALGFIPSGTEPSKDPDERIHSIDQAGIFVGIYTDASAGEVPVLELEYDRAMERNLPVLLFMESKSPRALRRSWKHLWVKLEERHKVHLLQDVADFQGILADELKQLSHVDSGNSMLVPPASMEQPEPATRARRVNLQMLADGALEADEEDLLDFSVYADAIAGLIDHPETRTPLTMAINGPWGAGKSTLGRMVSRRLEDKPAAGGTRPHVTCWFNSWMHEDATDLAAAFAGQVALAADRARPRWRRLISPLPTSMSSPGGRIRRRFFTGLFMALAALLVSLRLTAENGQSLKSLKPLVTHPVAAALVESRSPEDNLLFLLSVGTLTLLLVRWLTTAARSVSEFVSDPKAAADSGSMDRVRNQLAKLIRQATPSGSRFVVFIDDLERCRPPRSVDVLEVVNQLLSHQGIVTVIMADMPAVAACVEVKYEQLADIYRPSSATQKVGSYGRLYLQKIIQLQFDLPALRPSRLGDLIRSLAQPAEAAKVNVTPPQVHLHRASAWPVRWFNTGLVQQSWNPSFAWSRLWRNIAHQPSVSIKVCVGLALVFFAPLIFVVRTSARAFYPDPRSKLVSSKTTSMLLAIRATRVGIMFAYVYAVALIALTALTPNPVSTPLEPLVNAPLLYLAASLFAAGLAAALEARAQWRLNVEALAVARRVAGERILEGTESLDEIERELHQSSGFTAGDRRLLCERLYLFATSESDLFGDAQAEVLAHLPALPRSAKRLLNSLRLHFYVAFEMKILDDELTPAHLGKWIVLRDRWPELAHALTAAPARMAAIESADDVQRCAHLASIAEGLEGDEGLKSFCCSGTQLGPVLSRLLHLEARKRP